MAGTPVAPGQDLLEQSCYANMAMATLERFRPALNLKGPAAIDQGCANDIPPTFHTALRSAQEKKIKWMMSQCYPFFGTFSDGSPLGCNAEVIIVMNNKPHSVPFSLNQQNMLL